MEHKVSQADVLDVTATELCLGSDEDRGGSVGKRTPFHTHSRSCQDMARGENINGVRGKHQSIAKAPIKVNKNRTTSTLSQSKNTSGPESKCVSSFNTFEDAGDRVPSHSHINRRYMIVIAIVVVALILPGSIAAGIVYSKTSDDPNASRSIVDCGLYGDGMENITYSLSNGSTTLNSSLEVNCALGLSHAEGSATNIHCGADGAWEGSPNCTTHGSIGFSESNYKFTISERGILTCSVSQYPNWQQVRIVKSYADTYRVIFEINNITGVVQKTSNVGENKITFHNDGLIINVIFSSTNCSDEGTYYGLLIVGNNITIKSANTTVSVRAPCEDLKDCAAFGRDICVDDPNNNAYLLFAKKNCPLYCRFCYPTTFVCKDVSPACQTFDDGNLCTDPDYTPWVYESCMLYCHVYPCNGTMTTPFVFLSDRCTQLYPS